MFTVSALHKLLGRLVADGAGEAVVVFRDGTTPLGLRPGIFRVEGITPASVDGDGTALILDNAALEGPSVGRPLCIVASNPFSKPVRYIPILSGRYEVPLEPLERPRSEPHGPTR
jgi:hypothetical protein